MLQGIKLMVLIFITYRRHNNCLNYTGFSVCNDILFFKNHKELIESIHVETIIILCANIKVTFEEMIALLCLAKKILYTRKKLKIICNIILKFGIFIPSTFKRIYQMCIYLTPRVPDLVIVQTPPYRRCTEPN